MTPSKIIKDLNHLGFTRYQISKKTGLPQTTLGRWLKGQKADPDKLIKLDRFYKKVIGKNKNSIV